MEGRKRCYYEVLEVARNASADELKVAYKKLVMKWHPDKNLDKAEEATERFKEIQSAYAVLGDPNERAWYDSHREAILRGKNPAEGTDSDDEEEQTMNLWPFFSSSCYKGFGSDDHGFYAVYRGVFSSIEEAEKAEAPDHVPLPSFGDAKTSSDELLEFYRAWKNYTSDRSFGWAEQWKLSDAPNRQYRRAMEKDNKKKRDKKRKEFTELVRHLAEYVQKIDPRMQEALAARQKAEEEKHRAADARRKEEEDKRKKRVQELAARAAAEEEDDEEKWEKLMEGNPISRTKREKKDSDNKEEEEENDEQEGGEGDLTAAPPAAAGPVPAAVAEAEEEEEEGGYCAPCKKRFKSVQQLRQHKQQKKHKEIILALRRELEAQGETWDESEEEEKVSTQKQQHKGGKKKKGRKQRNDEDEEEEKLVAATEELSLTLPAPATPAAADETTQENGSVEAAIETNGQSEATEDGAAGAEGEKQGDETEETEGSGKKPRRRRPKEERAAKGAYACAACSASFAQRNALFSHLAATGHARPPTEVPAANAAAPKKGKRR